MLSYALIVVSQIANIFVSVEVGRAAGLVAGSAKFRLLEKRPHHGPFVAGYIGENLLVGDITKNGCAVFAR